MACVFFRPLLQPHGLSPCANVVKECGEEAGVGESLASTALPVGAVSYLTISNTGDADRHKNVLQ